MINVLIVDDEPLATEIIKHFSADVHNINIVGIYHDALEALEALKTKAIDLAFIDIQMPGMTGVELIKSLKHPPLFIFTTAYPNYAVEGFELDAVDYLLKPISKERLMRSIQKAENILEFKNQNQSNPADFIFVKSDKKMIKLKYADIRHVEGLKDYVSIWTDSGRVVTLHTMKGLENKLPTKSFLRIHRSYIVNLSSVTAVVGNMIEIKIGPKTKLLPIGKSYRERIYKMIGENKL